MYLWNKFTFKRQLKKYKHGEPECDLSFFISYSKADLNIFICVTKAIEGLNAKTREVQFLKLFKGALLKMFFPLNHTQILILKL